MDSFWRSSWDCADLTELEGSTLQLRPSRISNITDAKRASKQNESFEFFSLQLYVFFLIPSTMYVCMYVGRCQIDCIQCEIVYNSQEMIFDVISMSKFIIGHFWRTQTLHQSLSVGVDAYFLFTFFQQKRREIWIHVKDHTMKEVDIRLSGQTNTQRPIFLLSNIEH